ncbi:TIGR02922 family protein [Colwellia piezophila]|uniref:TIGR02922 family protein n=1 Tax=Colwellia piezophila TaxID=211668 RepID=UPI000360069E|nr:TIGR02922 family protein [Colwellia piezophila]
MKEQDLSQVTIIYYHEQSLELLHLVGYFPKKQNGRVILSDTFKKGKSIIAVCEGEINIMNKIGDRILPMSKIA